MNDGDEVVIRLRFLRDREAIPPAVRLRRALKILLRSFGLKNVGMTWPNATPTAPSDERAANQGEKD